MNRNTKGNLKGITAFVLTAAMLVGMNNGLGFVNVYAEEEQIINEASEPVAEQIVSEMAESEDEQIVNEMAESEAEQITDETSEPEIEQTAGVVSADEEEKYVDIVEHEGWVHFTDFNFVKCITIFGDWSYKNHNILSEMESGFDKSNGIWVDPAALMGCTELRIIASADISGFQFNEAQ